MCQYACFPAPKTVTSWTFARFLKSIVLARAVRKAVISEEFSMARGFPERSKRVRLVFDADVWVEAREAVVAELLLVGVDC